MQTLALLFGVEGSPRVCRALYPLISATAPTTTIHVAMEGTWEGHRSGAFSFDRKTFAQIVANFESNPNPVPLDYEHASETQSPAPACGWVHKLEVRDEGGVAHLYATVELTDEAAQYIREGRYRFSSGVFDFGAVDPITGAEIGCEMPSLALTNQPFIRGQKPIALSRRAGVSMSQTVNKAELISHLRKLEGDDVSDEQVQKLAAALGLLAAAKSPPAAAPGAEEQPPAAAPTDKLEDEKQKPKAAASAALAAPDAPVAAATPPASAVAAETPAPPAEESAPAPGSEASALLEQLMAQTGMSMEQLCEALKSMMGAPAAAPAPLSAQLKERDLALSARDHTIRALSQRAEAAEAEVAVYRGKEADDAVSVLIDEGRLLDNARADMRALYLSNRKQFDSLSAALPPVVPVGTHAAGQTPPTEKTPAIDESDPEVAQLRRTLSNTRLPKSAIDAAIQQRISERKASRI
jgi:phage I-like protein